MLPRGDISKINALVKIKSAMTSLIMLLFSTFHLPSADLLSPLVHGQVDQKHRLVFLQQQR